eukprot:626520-Rhodomonas_salina.2
MPVHTHAHARQYRVSVCVPRHKLAHVLSTACTKIADACIRFGGGGAKYLECHRAVERSCRGACHTLCQYRTSRSTLVEAYARSVPDIAWTEALCQYRTLRSTSTAHRVAGA